MENETNIKNLLEVIRKKIWLVLVLSISFSFATGIYSVYFTNPMYESSTRMVVRAEPDVMNTLMVLIKEPVFLEKVVEEIGMKKSAEELSTQISAGTIGGSSIVKISVVDSDPKMAAKISDTTMKVFEKEIPNLIGFNDISILSEAKVNNFPINESHERKIGLGFLVGLIVGIGLVFLLDFLNDSIKSERQVEQLLGVPVLGSITRFDKKSIFRGKRERRKIIVRGESFGYYK